MGWAYWNLVRIAFGAGQFDQVGAQIAGRPYALVTYGIDHFRGLGAKLAAHRLVPIRFWNFVPDISAAMEDGTDRYMAFNAGRYDGFALGSNMARADLQPLATAAPSSA